MQDKKPHKTIFAICLRSDEAAATKQLRKQANYQLRKKNERLVPRFCT